jgi:hypothetical protein
MQLGEYSISRFPIRRLQLTGLQAYKWLVYPFVAFVISRLTIFAASIIGFVMLPTDPGHWQPASGNLLIDLLARWDSQWYLWIVEQEYWLRPGQRSNVAFFPLYPLAIDLVAPFVGNNTVLAGIIVSNAAFLAVLIVLYQLTRLETNSHRSAARTAFYLSIFPTSFFFSMMYTESLFLFFMISAIYFARKQLWVWAALMGLLASTARVVGVLTLGLVLWEWLRVHGWQLETIHRKENWVNLWHGIKRDWMQLIVIAVIPLGLLSYMVFLQTNFGDPIAFSTVQSAWGRENIGPVAVVAQDIQALFRDGLIISNLSRGLNMATLIAILGFSVVVWRRLGAGYALYTLLAVLIPATSGSQSILRYALVCFPVFMVLGIWGRQAIFDRAYTIISAVLLGVFIVASVNWIFVA